MSVKVMSWVWDCSAAKGNDLLVLLAIADSADHDGSNAWPAVATLCRKTRLSRRTVQRSIVRLTGLGELRVDVQRGGPLLMRAEARPNAYTVLLGDAEAALVDNSGGASKRRGGGVKSARGGASPVTPNPSFTRPGLRALAARPEDQDPEPAPRADPPGAWHRTREEMSTRREAAL
jgi:Helix-turn-helix domain